MSRASQRRWRFAGLAAAMLLLAGCENAITIGGLGAVSLNGLWDWTARYQDSTGATVCSDTGSMNLSGSIYSPAFDGVSYSAGACLGAAGLVPSEHQDSVRGGLIAGNGLTFALRDLTAAHDRCAVTATSVTVSGDSIVGMSGSALCGALAATWSAERAAPTAAIEVLPHSATGPAGQVQHFTARLYSGSGARIYLRPLAWLTGDPATATVSVEGDAFTAGPGTTSIRATSGSTVGSATLTVTGATGYIAVSGGNANSCALTAAGETWCWGLLAGSGKVPSLVQGAPAFTALSVGTDFACGLTAAGAAWCWGDNAGGKLGNGTTVSSATPVAVSGGHAFVAISAGGHEPFGLGHACALTATGAAWCWGDNADGQLGDGALAGSLVPVAVTGGLAFSNISAGGRHTCGVTTAGRAACWGSNGSGQLGDGTFNAHRAPADVAFGGQFWVLSAGLEHTCGIAAGGLSGGPAACWGANAAGQLGDGTNVPRRTPVPVLGGLRLRDLSAGAIHSCGIVTGGSAYCWGANGWGQLGSGSFMNSLVPVQVSGAQMYNRISVGLYLYSDENHNSAVSAHSCAVTSSGIAWCWGDNLAGQLGSGLPGEASALPARVANQP